jgi:hypothetical protein
MPARLFIHKLIEGRRGRDRDRDSMVVAFRTTYAISTYHH